ncbi:hypothetical protein CGLO_15384 [Colletotrichum gloeosporioides Cg-14]|uniref:Uncharacterized protein n=1 Tax=Colletotrichum gloeosporioides (strain Cg-14) TaxID=1237896 RepID=T0JR42_COLGC|nr:hypothetical protein CGLO_15384 [Colletotrichum gloeosporioides Cg-14]
MSIDPVINFP